MDEPDYEDDYYCCWVCDAIATPIYDEAGNIVGSNCAACRHAER